ncbi:MAG: DUF2497 domain-containing protein [Alphaproteobacteria bacterium]
MSSTEQAPEPTMDEILASIRKIISDDEAGDETGGDAQPEVAEVESAAAEPVEPVESAAPQPPGDGLVDDLANALNDVQEAEAKSDEQVPEDILDLTKIVSDQPAGDAPQEEAAPPEAAAAPEAALVPEAPAAPEASAEPVVPAAPEAPAGESDIAALLAEAGVQEMADEAEAMPADSAAPSGEELNAAIEQDDTAVAGPAPVGEASISDALSALDQPAAETAPAETAPDEAAQSQDASFDADLVTSPEPAPQAPVEYGETAAPQTFEQAPEAEAVAEVEASPESDAQVQVPEHDAEEAQAEVVLSEPEAPVIEEPVEAAAALAGALEGLTPAEEAPAGSEDEAVVEAEAAVEAEEADTDQGADVAAVSGDVRTLEDSVKDLLRPMLREWLDDNMERIVQDEVTSANLKSSDG